MRTKPKAHGVRGRDTRMHVSRGEFVQVSSDTYLYAFATSRFTRPRAGIGSALATCEGVLQVSESVASPLDVDDMRVVQQPAELVAERPRY